MIRAALTAALIAAPAMAEAVICAPSGRLAEKLSEVHGERVVGQGIDRSGDFAIQIWASPDGETFTIVQVNPGGVSCLLAEGEGWDHRKMARGKES